MNFDLRKFLAENKLTKTSQMINEGISEEELSVEEFEMEEDLQAEEDDYGFVGEDEVAEEEAVEVDVQEYLKFSTVDEVMGHINKQVDKSAHELKMAKVKEAVAAIEGKLTSLEEDANVKDFISASKLREMRRYIKELRKMEERLIKEYDKKYAEKKKK